MSTTFGRVTGAAARADVAVINMNAMEAATATARFRNIYALLVSSSSAESNMPTDMMNTMRLNLWSFIALAAGVLVTLATSLQSLAAEPPAAASTAPTAIWPGEAPGEKGDVGAEYNAAEKEHKVRIANVTRPTIALRHAPADKDTGAAVLVCPGGGYNRLAMDIEGEDVARWLNDNGVTAILLKYRVPRRAGREKHEAPLQDVQRAMGVARQHAKEWNFDPNRLGVIGFSAGGHLCATLCGDNEKRSYPAVDDADKESCRPDFALLIYPFYMTPDEDTTKLAPEVHVSAKNPPSFLVMTQDDRVHYAYTFALAMKAAKAPLEMHIFPTGGHGYGLGKQQGGTAEWPALAAEWLKRNGWLEKPKQ
jgi:acetyl esterase/lipase